MWSIHCSWHWSYQIHFLLLSFSTHKLSPWLLVPLFEVLLKNSELKTTHHTFRIVACTFSENHSWNSCIYVGWICCWFSLLLWEVFLRVLQLSPLLKNRNIFKFQFDTRNGRWRTIICGCTTSKSLYFIWNCIYIL